jgi:DeoR/GlpR family transcriptional regulator of sugar metabolism
VISFDIAHVKHSFIIPSKCIYAKAKSADELLHLTLQESYSLPVITHAIAAIKLTMKQQRELNVCWNMVYRKWIGFNKWESVKSFVCGVGRLACIT